MPGDVAKIFKLKFEKRAGGHGKMFKVENLRNVLGDVANFLKVENLRNVLHFLIFETSI